MLIAAKGEEVPGYDETPVAEHMKGQYIDIEVDLGIGTGRGNGLDLRPDARLYRHQWQLPELIRPAAKRFPRRHLDRCAWCWSRRRR